MTVRPAEAKRSPVRAMPCSARCPTAASSSCHSAMALSPTTTTMSRNRPNGWPARSLSPAGLPRASWMASHPTARCSSPYPMNPIRVRASSGPLVATRQALRRALLATVMPLNAREHGVGKPGLGVTRGPIGYERRMTTSYHPAARPGAGLRSRELLQIAAVAGAALLFGVLLVLVRLQWVPLESVDRGLAAALNNAVAGHRPVVLALGFATRLGSHGVLLWLLAIASVVLLVRRRYRLVVFLVVSGIGSVILDPALKAAVGRLRPVVAHPVAIGGGDSFPSGHSLGSIIVYGALLMVFVPALPRRWRALAIAAAVVLVLAVGFTRLALGVHFLSDVLGACPLGGARGPGRLGTRLRRALRPRYPVGQVPQGKRQHPRGHDRPALVRRAPHAPARPDQLPRQRGRQHPRDPRGRARGRRVRAGVDPAVAAHRFPAGHDVRRADPVSRLGRARGPGAAGRPAPGGAAAHVELPVRARRRDDLPLRGDGGHLPAPDPRLVALAPGRRGGADAAVGDGRPDLPGHAPPHRHPRRGAARGRLADRDGLPGTAQL